jgi:hypothetical protein
MKVLVPLFIKFEGCVFPLPCCFSVSQNFVWLENQRNTFDILIVGFSTSWTVIIDNSLEILFVVFMEYIQNENRINNT